MLSTTTKLEMLSLIDNKVIEITVQKFSAHTLYSQSKLVLYLCTGTYVPLNIALFNQLQENQVGNLRHQIMFDLVFIWSSFI
jgi:DeoR/GlpR family transcriptional regulator of sugar metabolism